jgi:hypothetical protein
MAAQRLNIEHVFDARADAPSLASKTGNFAGGGMGSA